MDHVPATLEVLPDIADAVGDSVEVLFDSGIRRGADIVTETAPPEDSSVVDLADALRRSAEMQRRRSAGAKSTAGTPAKRGSGAGSAGRRAAGGGTNRTRSSGKAGPKAKSRTKRKAS
jgi:DNA end-binding protein Ku